MTTAIGLYATLAMVKSRLGLTDTDDDTIIEDICDQVNAYIEAQTERVMAPIASATYLYDGDGTPCLRLPVTADGQRIGGLRAVSLVEVADFTGDAYLTLASGDYFLRGVSMPGGPYDRLLLSDMATDYQCWPKGYATVRVTGTAGWATIPDEIVDVALSLAVRAYHARPTGSADVGGDSGADMVHAAPSVTPFVTARQRDILRAYTLVGKLI